MAVIQPRSRPAVASRQRIVAATGPQSEKPFRWLNGLTESAGRRAGPLALRARRHAFFRARDSKRGGQSDCASSCGRTRSRPPDIQAADPSRRGQQTRGVLCVPTQFRRLTKRDSIVISANSCWTGCASRVFLGCRRGSQERPRTLFFAVTQDFNGLRGSLRGPIVFADVRTLKASA